jgi:CDP-glucose 4,6-dehydratase
VVTSDKCYENREWLWGYRETEALGGRDPYSSSKACAELVAGAYRASFFSDPAGPLLATARAGNVIGGGDWAGDRLVPDIIRALIDGKSVVIRNPDAVRPWQHVLDPLAGYLMLAERLASGLGEFAEAWNFGPAEDGVQPVSWVVERTLGAWGGGTKWKTDSRPKPHEASLLKLDSAKARSRLSWRPCLDLPTALDWTVEWYRCYRDCKDMRQISLDQLRRYGALM